MHKIYLKTKNRTLIWISLFALIYLNTVHAGRIGDGSVLIEIQNNSLCFSIDKYKPRGYFFKSFNVGNNGLAVRNISVSKFQNEVIWSQSIPIEKNGSEYRLKPNQCIKYGASLNNYNSEGSIRELNSGRYTVIISGYDPEVSKMATFMSVFDIDVTNGKVSLKNKN